MRLKFSLPDRYTPRKPQPLSIAICFAANSSKKARPRSGDLACRLARSTRSGLTATPGIPQRPKNLAAGADNTNIEPNIGGASCPYWSFKYRTSS